MNSIRLVNGKLYVEGIGFSGQIEEAELPALKWLAMELKNLGLNGKVKAPLSLEEFKTTLKGHFDPTLTAMVSNPNTYVAIQIRASLADATPVGVTKTGELVAYLRGWMEEVNPGSVRGQQEAQGAQYVFHAVAYRLVSAGVELWDIDLMADKVVINGDEVFSNE